MYGSSTWYRSDRRDSGAQFDSDSHQDFAPRGCLYAQCLHYALRALQQDDAEACVFRALQQAETCALRAHQQDDAEACALRALAERSHRALQQDDAEPCALVPAGIRGAE